MKKISFLLMAFGLMVTSCTKDDFDYQAYMDNVKQDYNDLFTLTFGEIAPGHDWGFHADATGNRASMRAATGEWNGTHTKPHTWEGKSGLGFTLPADAVQIDTEENYYYDQWNDKYYYKIPNASAIYVSEDFEGELVLSEGFSSACSFYNYGNITGIKGVNYAHGDLTFYNAGTLVNTIGAINGQVVYNRGTFIIDNDDMYAKISKLYNSGNLELGAGSYTDWQGNLAYKQPDIKTNIAIYSTGTGVIELPGGAKWQAECHIDGTVYTDGYLYFLTPSTNKYICGIVFREGSEDKVEQGHNLNIDSDITTSYIKTYDMLLNGDNIFLTGGGYIKATKISTEGNGRTNANNDGYYEAIVVETNKTAMVDVNEFYIKNDKLGNHLGAGVYANFNSIKYKEGGQEQTATAANYTSDPLFAQNRINNTEVGGVSECGGPWGVPQDDNTIYGEKKRIIAEDLAAGQFRADFDFNDVVFDAQVNVVEVEGVQHYVANVEILAAGGTLPLYIGIPLNSDDTFNADISHEVHNLFGKGTGVMINTGTELSTPVNLTPKIENIDLGPVGNGGTDANTLVRKINDIPVVVVSSIRGAYELKTDIDYIDNNEYHKYQTTAPMKIAVPTTYKWTKERNEIILAYPKFSDYVQTKEPADWYSDGNKDPNSSDYLYNK